MKFTFNGLQYKIMFKYGEVPRRWEGVPVEARTVTATVFIGRGNDWDPVLVGVSQCHPLDRFEKEKGRVLALRKATEGTTNALLRTAVWDAYRDRKKALAQKGAA